LSPLSCASIYVISFFPDHNLRYLAAYYLSFSAAKNPHFIPIIRCGTRHELDNSACSSSASNPEATTATSTNQPAASGITVNIGFQKAATVLNALKSKGSLEQALTASGASVKWTEFPAGAPMLEAMNAGSIDFGYTGESPPIFAQAAGTPLVYVAYDPLSPKAEAIIVPKNSPIKTVAELKGKRVAFTKGSKHKLSCCQSIRSSWFAV